MASTYAGSVCASACNVGPCDPYYRHARYVDPRYYPPCAPTYYPTYDAYHPALAYPPTCHHPSPYPACPVWR